jgi:hypothetical protein
MELLHMAGNLELISQAIDKEINMQINNVYAYKLSMKYCHIFWSDM